MDRASRRRRPCMRRLRNISDQKSALPPRAIARRGGGSDGEKRVRGRGIRDKTLTLGEEKLDEVGAVLAGGTGDEGDLARAVASHGVHLAGAVLGRLVGAFDGGADGDGHCFVCV